MGNVISEFGRLVLGVGRDIQCTVMPDYTSVDPGIIVQYTGATDANYINGYFYKCTNNGWELTDVQDVSDKVNKVAGATTDDLASLTATGDLADSGKKLGDLVLKADVKDVLNSTSTTDPLSAKQGKVLADNLAANEESGAKNFNVYPYYETTKAENGLTFTDNGDGTVTVSGTAGATTIFYCHQRDASYANGLKISNGSYKFSGAINSNISANLAIRAKGSGSYEYIGSDLGAGLSFTIDGDYYADDSAQLEIALIVDSGTVISTPITFKPMLRDARVIDPTFVPYAETNLQLTRKTSGLSNENLLDNGWFTVNQRGFSSAIFQTGNVYTVDRWLIIGTTIGGSMSLSSSGMKLSRTGESAPGYLTQFLEGLTLGKPYTLSVLFANGTIESKTGIINSTADSISFNFANGLGSTRAYYFSGGSKWTADVIVFAGSEFTIRAVKLEVGTVSTLANDVEPNYTTELLKCQRYFERLKLLGSSNSFGSFGVGYSVTTTSMRATLWAKPKRNLPTVTFVGSIKTTNGASVTAISPVQQINSGIVVDITTSGVNLTDPLYLINIGSTADYIDFSADL